MSMYDFLSLAAASFVFTCRTNPTAHSHHILIPDGGSAEPREGRRPGPVTHAAPAPRSRRTAASAQNASCRLCARTHCFTLGFTLWFVSVSEVRWSFLREEKFQLSTIYFSHFYSNKWLIALNSDILSTCLPSCSPYSIWLFTNLNGITLTKLPWSWKFFLSLHGNGDLQGSTQPAQKQVRHLNLNQTQVFSTPLQENSLSS